MTENRLNIIHIASAPSSDCAYPHSRLARAKELQAKFERLWLLDPEQFNPLRNCMEQERLERTWQLLTKHIALANQITLDMGCAAGVFSRRLRDAGARVQAIDIAENALKKFQEIDAEGIALQRETMPWTHLADNGYQLIICTELIAEIPRDDYRLFFAELARLMQPEGYLICSSPMDIDSVDAVKRLKDLVQSEFDIVEDITSYHALYLHLKWFFAAPSRFIVGWQDADYKRKEMMSRKGWSRGWFWLNASPPFVWLWYVCEPSVRPMRKLLKNHRKTLLVLEKVCRFFWDQEGISHYLLIAKKRPFI